MPATAQPARGQGRANGPSAGEATQEAARTPVPPPAPAAPALLAYRFALDPTPRQARELACHAGAARMAFNWALARVTANLDQRTAERSYGIADADLTSSLNWTLAGLRRDWNAAKDDVAPWWRQCSKEAFTTGLDSLSRALQQWSASRQGIRKGPPAGFPRFRSRRRTTPKIRFTTGAIRCEDTHAVLPRIGRVKIAEHGPRGGLAGRLARAVAGGTARVVSVSVRFQRGRWYASFTVEQTTPAGPMRPGPADPDAEDLNVAGMTRSAKGSIAAPGRNVAAKAGLNQAIADAGFGEFRRQLAYKTSWRGGRVIVADRWYPSSKTCSGCGAVRAKLSLSERMYTCPACVLRVDRDVNAAVNLAGYGRRVLAAEQTDVQGDESAGDGRVAASGAETVNGRGADQRTAPARRVAVKRQPVTAAFVVVGQAGTPVSQGAGVW